MAFEFLGAKFWKVNKFQVDTDSADGKDHKHPEEEGDESCAREFFLGIAADVVIGARRARIGVRDRRRGDRGFRRCEKWTSTDIAVVVGGRVERWRRGGRALGECKGGRRSGLGGFDGFLFGEGRW